MLQSFCWGGTQEGSEWTAWFSLCHMTRCILFSDWLFQWWKTPHLTAGIANKYSNDEEMSFYPFRPLKIKDTHTRGRVNVRALHSLFKTLLRLSALLSVEEISCRFSSRCYLLSGLPPERLSHAPIWDAALIITQRFDWRSQIMCNSFQCMQAVNQSSTA